MRGESSFPIEESSFFVLKRTRIAFSISFTELSLPIRISQSKSVIFVDRSASISALYKKGMKFESKTMNCLSKTMNFVSKMMNFAPGFHRKHHSNHSKVAQKWLRICRNQPLKLLKFKERNSNRTGWHSLRPSRPAKSNIFNI